MWFVLSITGSLVYWFLIVPRGWMEVGGFYVPLIYALSLVTATIGYHIGRMLRNFVMPDAIWVNGGFADLLTVKIWWMIGPQTIGYSGGAIVPYAAIMGLIEYGVLSGIP
jgi:hypothetical protein